MNPQPRSRHGRAGACPRTPFARRGARFSLAAASLLLGLVAGLPGGARAQEHGGHHGVRTDGDMAAWVEAWFAAHPVVGAADPAQVNAVADTFNVGSFYFDSDANQATAPDTAKIFVGDTVLWRWIGGSHTVTSGLPTDVDAGSLFDAPMTSTATTFSFTFGSAGTYPFFCRPHSGLMRGVVVVSPVVGVQPLPGAGGGAGFIVRPAPSPTRDGATFRFALATGGLARLEIVDARGRIVARPVQGSLEAGAYVARWDRTTLAGGRAAAGVYFARLEVPGIRQSERIVVID